MNVDDLIEKEENTPIEMCILWVLDDAYSDGYGTDIINQAAKDNADDATNELADLRDLRARVEAAERDRDELFMIAVKSFDAMFEIGVGLAPDELTPRVRALDHALANDLNDELWERVNAATLAKGDA